MPRVSCKSCGQRIDADESLVGKTAHCPTCGEIIEVAYEAADASRETAKANAGGLQPHSKYAAHPSWMQWMMLAGLGLVVVQLVRLEMRTSGIGSELSRVNESLGADAYGSGLNGISSDISSIRSDLSSLDTDIGGVATDVTSVQAEISALESGIDELKNAVGVGFYAPTGSLKNEISNIQSEIGNIQSEIRSIRRDLR